MQILGETEPDSLRADLEAAFDAPETAGDTASTDAATGASDSGATGAEVAGKTGASADTSSDGRARGPDGKFVSSTAEPAASAAKGVSADKGAGGAPAGATTAPTKLATPSTDTTKASDQQPSTAADAPPVGWTAEGKAEWASLSPAVKAAVLKREVEISSGGRQWSEQRRQLEETIAPIQAAASRRGLTAAQGAQLLARAQDELDANTPAALERIARSYGLSITVNGNASPSNGQPAADGSSRIDPSLYRDERVDAIQARLDAADRRETEMTVQRVTAFASDPAHPHFDAVSAELMAMLPLLKASNPRATPEQLLQDAYDRAVWGNPETRRALEAQRLAEADAARRSTNSAEVNKARLASSSIRPGAPAGLPAAGPKDSIREELLAAWGS